MWFSETAWRAIADSWIRPPGVCRTYCPKLAKRVTGDIRAVFAAGCSPADTIKTFVGIGIRVGIVADGAITVAIG